MAISIPIFTAQLEKARIATDEANVRGWYAQQVANYISDDTKEPSKTYPSDGFPALKAKGAEVKANFDADTNTFTVSYSADKLDEDLVIDADGGNTGGNTGGN